MDQRISFYKNTLQGTKSRAVVRFTTVISRLRYEDFADVIELDELASVSDAVLHLRRLSF